MVPILIAVTLFLGVLKLTGKVTSWWIVAAPIGSVIVVFVVFVLSVLAGAMIQTLIDMTTKNDG